MSFDSLGLRAELLRSLSESGYTRPTPVQGQSIPLILAGRDLLAGAQTGTGKTAGFALPVLQRLSASAPDRGRGGDRRGPEPVRALILTPTRELALQVEESVRTYGRHLPHRSLAVFGGVGIVPQIQRLRRGVDIVVATPGRLLDHISQRTVDLSRVEILVLDEADRMLDMGFIRDIRKILAVLPRRRQTLFFSATFSDEIRKLAGEFLSDPASVQVTPRNAAAELVTQAVHPVDSGRKRALLSHLIASGSWRQVLVFTRTKHGANRLATQLATDGITATAIHGNKSQANRTRALRDFKHGAVRVLVATDIAARGLDIDQLPHVVNYDLPYVPEDYVHRIGRTGRAGMEGTAISLVSAEEHELLDGIERLLRRGLTREVIPGFEPRSTAAAAPSKPVRGARPAGAKRGDGRSADGPRGGRSTRGADAPRAGQSRRSDGRSRRGDAPKAPAGSVRASRPVEAGVRAPRPVAVAGETATAGSRDGFVRRTRRPAGRRTRARRSPIPA